MDREIKLIPLGRDGKLTAIDLFCGAGGVSQGMIDSHKVEVIAAVNHSPEAIAAHKKNNPNIVHLTEKIEHYDRTLLFLPTRTNILWASAECTHHSIAKGGQSRDPDSRSLSDYLDEYVRHSNPDYFIVENVKEFTSWGPVKQKLDKKGNPVYDKMTGNPVMVPIPELKTIFFNIWVSNIESLGYEYQDVMLNSADYGAHTSRTRYFGVFAKRGLPIEFPLPTHSKTGKNGLKKWNPCKEKIDLDNEGESIFGRKYNMNIKRHLRRPLADKTQARIAYGLRKYHLNDFISKSYGGGGNSKDVSSMDEPLHTVRNKDCHAPIKVKKNYIVKQQGQKPGQKPTNAVSSTDEPLHTIMTTNRHRVVTVDEHYIVKMQHGVEQVSDVNDPLHTIMTHARHQIVKVRFINKKQGGEKNVGSVDEPYHTITTEPGDQVVSSHFITQHIHGAPNASDVEGPLPTIITKDLKQMISIEKINYVIKKHSGKHQSQSIDEPLHTILTNDQKAVITIEFNSEKQAEIYDEKVEFFRKFFPELDPHVLAIIVGDIKMRYLNSRELADITGFHPDTELGPNETLRKKHIGNAVPPILANKICEALHSANEQLNQAAA